MATLFTKIINREIPVNIVYEDEQCLAFQDIDPKAPTHILIIPKKEIPKISEAAAVDQKLFGHLPLKAGDIARNEGVLYNFRFVVNNSEGAGQTVFHLHIHLMAGRAFNWPPR